MNKFKYAQGDIVEFDNMFGVSGVGKVVGVATTSVVTGTVYIIEVMSNTGMASVPGELYPFTNVTCSEFGMNPVAVS